MFRNGKATAGHAAGIAKHLGLHGEWLEGLILKIGKPCGSNWAFRLKMEGSSKQGIVGMRQSLNKASDKHLGNYRSHLWHQHPFTARYQCTCKLNPKLSDYTSVQSHGKLRASR